MKRKQRARRVFGTPVARVQPMRRLAALVLVAMLIGVVPVLAATVDITIPIETIVRGAAGSRHVLAVVDVPAESRGETCQVTAVSHNQSSAHPNSNLSVSSQTVVEILDVENQAGQTLYAGGLLTLGDQVTVTLTLGADRVFSAGLNVEIDCPPFNSTTTTTAPVSSSSSVADSSTSTSGGAGDTTATSGGVGDTTETSGGGGDTVVSSVSPTEAAVEVTVLGVSITAADASVAGSSETLPFTGIADGLMGGVAFAFVALGGLVVLSVRRRETEPVIAREWQPRIDFYETRL
ncbi:MAG: hypothetical protein ACXW15_07180 [Acidimicrobiia bacterium]